MANINLLYQSLHPGLDEHNNFGCDANFAIGPFGQMVDDGMSYANSSELSAPEYSTDDFRMFSFKVARCSKRYVHDWRCCPFAHPTENARRRDPRTVRYLPVPCPDYKRGICLRGDTCPYSHGVYECWLHPAKYKTQLCKEGPHCRRPVCFFAHSVLDLRQPTHLWEGPPGSERAAAAAPTTEQPPVTTAAALMQQSSSDAAFRLQSVEEAFNNCNAGGDSTRSASVDHNNMMGSSSSGGVSGTESPPRSPSVAGNGDSSSSPDSPVCLGTEVMMTQQQQQQHSTELTGVELVDPIQAGLPAVRPRGASFDLASGPSDPSVAAAAALSQTQQRTVADALLSPTATEAAANANGNTDGDGSAPWAQKLAEGITAAAAMASIPVNERPMLPSSAPRMSNAVARKLGLAPNKPPAAAPAPVVPRPKPAAMSSPPPRQSLDTLLHQLNSAPSLEQQLAAAMVQQQQVPQNRAMSMPMYNPAAGAAPGPYGPGDHHTGGVPFVQHQAMAASFPPSPAGTDAMGIHPALLNLVAAHMGPPGANGNSNGYMQMQGMPMAGGAKGHMMDPTAAAAAAANGDPTVMAQLLQSVQGWNLGPNAGKPGMEAYNGQMNGHHVAHRSSSDGMLGVTGLPQVMMMQVPMATPFYLPNDLEMSLNNQAGGPGPDC